ncbi:uncharacterized protein LOC114534670 [Dendronephthya gigantea]|uniref:uncharacterized protein LOC114534670 n=1 Tax=Dendronephthya gigantea TaxID=151771 RepID=UPI00106AA822|nr:uncharacterized protein LOC114534670 [Dendronephthya gigantea]
MVIHKAHYGDFNKSRTFDVNAAIDAQCSRLTNCQVKPLCSGKSSCELTVNNNLLPSKYCPDIAKELYVEYTCVDNYVEPITTATNIRLSKSPNKGFLEIKNGSTWRKVNEEIPFKNRENILCERLGFIGTSWNNVSTKEIGNRQVIATGDLCYNNTKSSNTPCCTHLLLSTVAPDIKLPYFTCSEICENPLLQNETKFPDTVFSGSGSTDNTKYKEARFSSNGWCPTESGNKYLKIDLLNEYHITRVMIMGDKDQTKSSGSYSLKYSHNESLVDGGSGLQITGNMYSFQASTTDVDIYNARYIKIQSTGNTDFCLRIELCGEDTGWSTKEYSDNSLP